MPTQRQQALKGIITREIRQVARDEHLPEKEILRGVASGIIAIPFNPLHKNSKGVGIGRGMRVKVNANIGTSADYPNVKEELKKLKAALDSKTDAVMDLSTGGNINAIRKQIIKNCPVPLGTVPIYQAMVEDKMTIDGMFSVVESQAKEGVDFMTIHCGVTRASVDALKKHPRLMDIVSRGGALMAKWIIENDQENPFYEYY
ncbi:MAG: phosphomethylpyrimidine synthase ThiC, partial [Candidatus Margulisiibacteriota bacterium]